MSSFSQSETPKSPQWPLVYDGHIESLWESNCDRRGLESRSEPSIAAEGISLRLLRGWEKASYVYACLCEEEVGRRHQGMDRPEVPQVPEDSGKQGKKWRKQVAKSSVVPQRPSRLRDR